jgi:hypothetical protein
MKEVKRISRNCKVGESIPLRLLRFSDVFVNNIACSELLSGLKELSRRGRLEEKVLESKLSSAEACTR